MTASKYRNKRTVRDNITFASKAEADRYSQLKLLERAGEITALVLQPRFICVVGGVKVCTYIADFSYYDKGRGVVEDVKGYCTDVFRLKRRLVEALNPGLTITLVGPSKAIISKPGRRKAA